MVRGEEWRLKQNGLVKAFIHEFIHRTVIGRKDEDNRLAEHQDSIISDGKIKYFQGSLFAQLGVLKELLRVPQLTVGGS
jgi:hypothetical protein